jgi:hypothetical protein
LKECYIAIWNMLLKLHINDETSYCLLQNVQYCFFHKNIFSPSLLNWSGIGLPVSLHQIYIYNIYKCGHKNVLSKRQVWMPIFHSINLKKNHRRRCHGYFFTKKLILNYYFCLKSGSVFLLQIFIIAPLPKGYTIVFLIINW